VAAYSTEVALTKENFKKMSPLSTGQHNWMSVPSSN